MDEVLLKSMGVTVGMRKRVMIAVRFFTSGDYIEAVLDTLPEPELRPTPCNFQLVDMDVHPKLLCRHVSLKQKLVKIL